MRYSLNGRREKMYSLPKVVRTNPTATSKPALNPPSTVVAPTERTTTARAVPPTSAKAEVARYRRGFAPLRRSSSDIPIRRLHGPPKARMEYQMKPIAMYTTPVTSTASQLIVGRPNIAEPPPVEYRGCRRLRNANPRWGG